MKRIYHGKTESSNKHKITISMGMKEKASSYAHKTMDKFEKRKNQILLIDVIVIVITILFLGTIRPDKLMLMTYILVVGYLFYTKREKMLSHLAVSSLIAIVWTFLMQNFYGYNTHFMTIFGMNIYPIFAWSLGLLAAYAIYIYFEDKLEPKKLLGKLLLFSLIYWPLLIASETIAYHIFDIQNTATASYVGLPLCDCIHAPIWMQISYFAIGPIFLLLCNMLKLYSPYDTIKDVM